MTLIVGFTGTRDQITAEQHRSFRQWITDNHPDELHHGCCHGADEFAAFLGACLTKKCVGHPPIDEKLVSEGAVLLSDKVRDPTDYLARNQNIVNECDVLVAMPKYDENDSRAARSGTWAMVRMARRSGKPVVLFMADGRVLAEDEIKNLQPAKVK